MGRGDVWDGRLWVIGGWWGIARAVGESKFWGLDAGLLDVGVIGFEWAEFELAEFSLSAGLGGAGGRFCGGVCENLPARALFERATSVTMPSDRLRGAAS
jgi:hypothetical protein